ncbi:MAG: hypothetical protein N3D74_00935 [Caldisericia bacterium]|nr:hypothetical protein [Caldisericia bacterium]
MSYKKILLLLIINLILFNFNLIIKYKNLNAQEGYWVKITDETYGGYINYFEIDPINPT